MKTAKNKSISPETMMAYVDYHNHCDTSKINPDIIDHSDEIFSTGTLEDKKQQSFLLAHLGTPASFEALKRRSKQEYDPVLLERCEMCLSECAMNVEADLEDDDEVTMITGGLGGDGQRLLCYFILFLCPGQITNAGLVQYIEQSIEKPLDELDSYCEQIDHKDDYIICHIMQSIETSGQKILDALVDAVNSHGDIVCSDGGIINWKYPDQEFLDECRKCVMSE